MALTYLQSTNSPSDLTTYTFSSQNLGTAASDRYIIVAVGARKSGATTSISSVTVAGITATQVIQQANNVTNTNIAGIYIAAVPTGTTGNVVVTFGAGMVRCAIDTYRATGINPTAFDALASIAGNPSVALDIPANGGAIGFGATAAATSATWTGLTERSDTSVETFSTFSGGSDDGMSAETNRSVTITFGSSSESVGVFASWELATVSVVPQDVSMTTGLGAATIELEGTTMSTYYFDGHNGIFDLEGVWSNDSYAFDGNASTATSATTSTNGNLLTATNLLQGSGTNATGSGGSIVQVRTRIRGDSQQRNVSANVRDGSDTNTILGSPTKSGSVTDGAWVVLDAPTGGWTWDKVQGLYVQLAATGSTPPESYAAVSIIDVEVAYFEAESVELSPDDLAIATGEDSLTITQAQDITVQDVAVNVSEDGNTIAQNHVIGTTDIGIALSEDTNTITQVHQIGPAGFGVGLSLDTTTTQETGFILTPAILALGVGVDSATIAQVHAIVIADVSIGGSIDSTTASESGYVLAVQDIEVGPAVDGTVIAQAHHLGPADLGVGSKLDATSIAQLHQMATQDMSVGTALDTASIAQVYQIDSDAIGVGAYIAATTAEVGVIAIHTADIMVSSGVDDTTLTQVHQVVPNHVGLSLREDAVAVGQAHSLVTADIGIGTTADGAALSILYNLSTGDLALGLLVDAINLSQHHMIYTFDMTLALHPDIAVVLGPGKVHGIPTVLTSSPSLQTMPDRSPMPLSTESSAVGLGGQDRATRLSDAAEVTVMSSGTEVLLTNHSDVTILRSRRK